MVFAGMSLIKERTQKAWYHRLCCNILKAGAIPRHVAFIMDGNRRFAKKNSIEQTEGHLMGFDKLAEVMSYIIYYSILILSCLYMFEDSSSIT